MVHGLYSPTLTSGHCGVLGRLRPALQPVAGAQIGRAAVRSILFPQEKHTKTLGKAQRWMKHIISALFFFGKAYSYCIHHMGSTPIQR